MRSNEFNKKVWAALKLIPRGRVTTYKELAKYLEKSKAARAVGNACGKNPNAPDIPCHRVIRNDGRIGGYSGGVAKKIKFLKKEGIEIKKGKVENFSKIIYGLK
jgi:methylated-DNA-[protein]-cysteine S-methyltransferase